MGIEGVLLVTGGNRGTGTGLYWHLVTNGSTYGSGLDGVNGLFTSGVSDAQIQVVVSGNNYSAYVNGSPTPATTITTSAFASGGVGLYGYNSHQTFANFSVQGQSAAGPFVVNDPGDLGFDPEMGPAETADGAVTLRSAIQQVDNDGGGSIEFASGMTITTSGLPAITASGVTIDGGTLGSIVVKGEENGPSGLVLDGAGTLIEGLEITNFSGDGIDVDSSGNTIGGTAAGVVTRSLRMGPASKSRAAKRPSSLTTRSPATAPESWSAAGPATPAW